MTTYKKHGTSKHRFCLICGCTDTMILQDCQLAGNRDHIRRFVLCRECSDRLASRSPTRTENQAGIPQTMSEIALRRETRKQKAFDRLGTDHPICACCLSSDRRFMESHHLEGEKFGETLINLCRNCHRILSDGQQDHPPQFGEPPITEERIGHWLLGLADLLELLVTKLKEFGNYLIDKARGAAAVPAETTP